MQKRILSYRVLLRCFWVLLLPLGASAQIGNPGLVYQGAYNNVMFSSTQSAIQRSMQNSPASGNSGYNRRPPAANGDFSYRPSSNVSNKLMRAIAGNMATRSRTSVQSNVDMLTNAALLREFGKLLHQYNYDSHNLADVFAAYVILSWEAATGNDASKSREGIDAFRKEVHGIFSRTPKLATLGNEQKQAATETLSYLAILTIIINRELHKKGNTTEVKDARDNMRQLALQVSGMDVTRYSLGKSGLVLKN